MYQLFGKRLLDLTVASVALIVLAPVMLIVGVLVRWRLGTPALFRQLRPGRHGKTFTILKFRTMTDERDAAGNILDDGARQTRFGSFLRATSLDELPELVNVLRGDMSLVGPRPLHIRYLPLYSPEQARRHDVLPGITGLAQVRGRNATTWPERLSHDVWYVDHLSLGLDLSILFQTLWTVVQREGINQQGQATMEDFTGQTA